MLKKRSKILILATLPVLIVLSFFAYSYFSQFISSEEDARKCAIASLNGFGLEHNFIKIKFVGKQYSELMESIYLNELSGGEYFFTATLKSIYGPVIHRLVITSHGACPVFFSEYNVTIEADDEIYKEFVNDTKALGGHESGSCAIISLGALLSMRVGSFLQVILNPIKISV